MQTLEDGGTVPQQGPFADDTAATPGYKILSQAPGQAHIRSFMGSMNVDQADRSKRESDAALGFDPAPEKSADDEIKSLKGRIDSLMAYIARTEIPAVLAERERCAKVADTWDKWSGRTGYDAEEYACGDIAVKIRGGE